MREAPAISLRDGGGVSHHAHLANNARALIGECAPAYRSDHGFGLWWPHRYGDGDRDR
jgi:hypothetical protein